MLHLGPKAADFVWASGIENTFVPQTRPRHRALDEYRLMGHYEHWREDLALTKDLGFKVLRWGVPWYRVEPLPGEFDWRWIDQVIPYMVEVLGITPIIDLMHYGCPFWLRREFASQDYPLAVAAYSAAFAERYRGLVKWYTPLNEPVVNALMCGHRGAWPPYLHGEKGYVRITLQLVKGMLATMEAIRAVDPNAMMVHVEATGICKPADASMEELARHNCERGFLSTDLLTGRVTPDHCMYKWLIDNGARSRELEEITCRATHVDVIGLNFYPQWSTKEVYVNDAGKVSYRVIEKDGAGFGDMVESYYRRYGVPIVITETSAKDSDEERSVWLDSSLRTIKGLREKGVPVLGYTWFPLFTMIDWRYRWERGPLERYLLELGLYHLDNATQPKVQSLKSKEGRWKPSPLVEQFRQRMNNPQDAVGDLAIG